MKKLFLAALAALIFAVPPITEAAPIIGAITGAACLAVMIKAGGRADAEIE